MRKTTCIHPFLFSDNAYIYTMVFVDILIIIPLIYAAWKGFKHGIIIEVFTLLALFVGIYAGIHFFDFAGDLYGASLEIAFIARIRDERWFPSPAALVQEIHRDIEAAKKVLHAQFPLRYPLL